MENRKNSGEERCLKIDTYTNKRPERPPMFWHCKSERVCGGALSFCFVVPMCLSFCPQFLTASAVSEPFMLVCGASGRADERNRQGKAEMRFNEKFLLSRAE